MNVDVFLDQHEVSNLYGVSTRTLARWRSSGDGPAFVRIGPRRVVYRQRDCDKWSTDRTFAHRAAEIAASLHRAEAA